MECRWSKIKRMLVIELLIGIIHVILKELILKWKYVLRIYLKMILMQYKNFYKQNLNKRAIIHI